MPSPNSSKAPLFNGEPSELLEFFELFENLASTYGLTNADKCKCLVRYVDLPMKRCWIILTGYEKHDYNVFKQNILDQYPGANRGQHYTIRDLERIIVDQADNDICSETELFQYCR
ncbi:hypothetical protein K503DRAFT_794870 [Rhizopogon vinicolor AM-OR11-026]|uniref:Uncharacterized protein n=1 Tax=Rhizopogon vinicolor AM-OR11-026 TaxID=1314800 RepID=A0A1B7MH13_9AGAM|nr:hypothetical protein K503DRAFT_794870 [Rhizopogon vinicolor AM-OR11-026]